MDADPLAKVRSQLGVRIAEIRDAGPRLSPLELYSKIDAIRQLAVDNGLATLEGLMHRSAQLALLPGHRVATQCCLEHFDEALQSESAADRTSILAALALRLN
jgi:hypothetical protein